MNRHIQILIFVTILLSACTKKPARNKVDIVSNSARVQGQILNSESDEIIVIQHYKPFTVDVYDTIRLDDTGKFTIEFDSVDTEFRLRIILDNKYRLPLLIAPNYDLQFIADLDIETWEAVQFSGKGALPNEFLWGISQHPDLKKLRWKRLTSYKDEKEIVQIVSDYYRCKDSLLHTLFIGDNQNVTDIHQAFYDNQKISNKFNKNGVLLRYAINNEFDKNQSLYFFDKYIDKDLFDFNKYDKYHYLRVITDFFGYTYCDFLVLNIHKLEANNAKKIGLYEPFYLQLLNKEFPQSKIKSKVLGSRFSSSFYRRLAGVERNYSMDSLIDSYRGVIANDNYLEELKQENIRESKKYFSLYKGDSAPNFSLKGINDYEYSLSSFKGKHLLIDVWSNFCKPCLEAMPVLKSELSEFDTTQFQVLSVYLSSDREKWDKFRKKYEPMGLQLIAEKGSRSDFAKDYLVRFLPRYILIDDKGEIVDFYAEKPEGGELKKQVKEMLALK